MMVIPVLRYADRLILIHVHSIGYSATGESCCSRSGRVIAGSMPVAE